jgi:DNA-binding response OmpR family regulator/HAMP domain-containing protein
VEVTLATEPLDGLLSGVVGQLAVLAALLLGSGILVTWTLAKQVVEPLRILRQHAIWISEGRLDEAFHHVPRPPDEVGDLATHFSVMAGILKGRREELEAQIIERSRALRLARAAVTQEETAGESGHPHSLAMVIHDLKSPITGIKAFAEILLDDPEIGPAERARFLESIRSESDRLTERLDRILASPEAQARREAPGPQDGDPLLDEAMAAAAAAEAAASIGGGPPSGAGLRRILVASADDPLRALLRDIFSGDGAEVVEASDAISTLRIARQMMPDGVVLDLLMEGGEALTMLGDLRQDRRTEGIPVLPISVVMQGDRLRAGAVSFQPKPLDRDRFLAAVRSALGEASREPGRVLVVDDDRYVAEAVGALLAQQGMDVQLVAGGEEALLAAREDRPDLIVLDLKMPGLDGVAVIRRLRALPETVDRPVILMTAHDIPREDQTGWPGVDLSREMFVRGVRAALREAALR